MMKKYSIKNDIYLWIFIRVGRKLFEHIAVCYKGKTSNILGMSFTNSNKYMKALMNIDTKKVGENDGQTIDF